MLFWRTSHEWVTNKISPPWFTCPHLFLLVPACLNVREDFCFENPDNGFCQAFESCMNNAAFIKHHRQCTQYKKMPQFKEPDIKWQDSKAKKLVLQYLREKKIPLSSEEKNDEGKRITSAMVFNMVCSMDGGENAKYDPKKFSQRLSALRKKIREEGEEKSRSPTSSGNTVKPRKM